MKAIVLSAVMVGALSSVMLAGCVAYPGPAEVTIGWHGDRYWDGNRYWERATGKPGMPARVTTATAATIARMTAATISGRSGDAATRP